MSKTFEILKTRWSEVLLVIAIQAGAALLFTQAQARAESSGLTIFSLAAVSMIFMVIGQMLALGFMRTACSSPNEHQPPAELLIAGKKFFWRIFALSIILAAIYLVIAYTVFRILGLFQLVTGEFNAAPSLVKQFCYVTGLLILIKPTLLIPAIIIVIDIRLSQTLKHLKNYKLSKALEAILLAIACWGFSIIASLAPDLDIKASLDQYFVSAVIAAVSAALTIAMTLSAVLFVAASTPVIETGENPPAPDNP